MSTTKKIVIGVGVVVVLGLVVYANLGFTRTTGTSVATEKIQQRDLEAIVSASGTIQPKRSINVGAESPGRVVDLQFREGDIVKTGQFLMQVDPRNLQIQVDSQEASLAAARSQIEEGKRALESARASLAQAEATFHRQEGLLKSGLTSKADYDAAESSFKMQQASVAQGEQSLKTQETRLKQQDAALENAKYDLSKNRIVSPIDGVITKRSVELGEMVAGSTFSPSNLLTVADMSVVTAEIQVDETDIPNVRIGQPAKVTVDALPGQTFTGKVTEVGNSPILATGASSTTRATDFKVVVTLDQTLQGVRPGFTCTAVITTATRQQALSVPIQAETVREMVIDADGKIVPPEKPKTTGPRRPVVAPVELKPGQSRKEIEGVFLIRDGHATFVPVKTGIAGEKYFEVLDGLKAGDEVITGPFASVRNLKDGDAVKVDTSLSAQAAASASTTAK